MKVCWVTGGGSGIGRALAQNFYERGYHVVISGRRKALLDNTCQEIAAKPGGKIMALSGDVASASDSHQIHQTLIRQWGPVDILVNNAGRNNNQPFAQTILDDYRQSLEINCLGAIACIQMVLPKMLVRHSGAIVNIASVYGKWASANSISYSVGKYALAGVTDALQQDLAKSGVHVLGVYPGFIRTAMTLPFVVPGSMRDRMGKSPEAMAGAILSALDRRQRELYFPWYVSWVLLAHRWMPSLMDRLAARVKR